MITCAICFEAVRIPVKLICFHCAAEHGKPKCNSIQRLCITCAREFLELNKPRNERRYAVKCLTCPAICYPSQLNAASAYEKDFLLMSIDERDDYECIHGSCGFRGTQMDLNRHLMEECPRRHVFCLACRKSFRDDDQEHKSRCELYTGCFFCRGFVKKDMLEAHLHESHLIKTCKHCKKHVPLHSEHEETCTERKVSCPHCFGIMKMVEFEEHKMQEIDWKRMDIETLRNELRLQEKWLAEMESPDFRPLDA